MSLPSFEYSAPKTIEQTVALLTKFEKQAELLAGGTDLILDMRNKKKAPKYIIDLKGIPDLDNIEFAKDKLVIGALTPIVAIRKSEIIKRRFTALFEAATAFASWQVQNRATIGGNICRSSPAGDMIPPLLVFDAQVRLIGRKGQRDIPLDEFFIGPGRNLMNKDEVLTQIMVPSQEEATTSAFKKIERSAEDIAKINCAVRLTMTRRRCKDIRIALGAVGPIPIRARKTENFIINKEMDDVNIEKAAQKVIEDIKPITDIRSTAEYRNAVSKVLVRDLINIAIDRKT